MQDEYRDLIQSSRVSDKTRGVLQERGKPDVVKYKPVSLSQAELQTLRSVLSRVIPQNDPPRISTIDVASRIDQMLAEGQGDGWRYATLPGDADACGTGLRLLDAFAEKLKGTSFKDLTSEEQDGMLEGIVAGRIHSASLDLQLWFEDLRADATQIYVAHPETLARMGYSGIADDSGGFTQLGIGKLEAWEPKEQ